MQRNDADERIRVGRVLAGHGAGYNRDAVGTRVVVEQAGAASRWRELHAVKGF